MERFFPSLLLLIAALLTASNAFLVPSSIRPRHPPATNVLHQSSSDDDDDGSSAINIALITSAVTSDHHEELRSTLRDHPFCKMTGIQLSILDVPTSSPWSKEHVVHLQQADIACFAHGSDCALYLKSLEDHLDIPKDISDEDRRKLPNRLDLVGDILGDGIQTTDATLMAACPNTNTARDCLNSGRWMPNHIYYPKETQGAVALKTAPIDAGEGSGELVDEDEDIDVKIWADSVVQAVGDVMERKFWGGGW